MNTSLNSCERVLIFDMILSEQMVHMHYLSRWLVVQVKNPSLLVSFTQCLITETQRRGTRLPRASITERLSNFFSLTILHFIPVIVNASVQQKSFTITGYSL